MATRDRRRGRGSTAPPDSHMTCTRSMLGLALVVLVTGSPTLVGRGLPEGQAPAAPNPARKNPHCVKPPSFRGARCLSRIFCADGPGLAARGYRGPDLIAVMAAGATD